MRPQDRRAAQERTSGNFAPHKQARRQSFSITSAPGNQAQRPDVFFRSTSKRQNELGFERARY
jgi:hypothetical protein